MRLSQRLRRLEARVPKPDPGCPACRHRRGRHVLVDCQAQRDGTVVPLQPLPAPCAACGKLPESIIEAIMPYTEDGILGPEALQAEE
jgi:hypothetical protein